MKKEDKKQILKSLKFAIMMHNIITIAGLSFMAEIIWGITLVGFNFGMFFCCILILIIVITNYFLCYQCKRPFKDYKKGSNHICKVINRYNEIQVFILFCLIDIESEPKELIERISYELVRYKLITKTELLSEVRLVSCGGNKFRYAFIFEQFIFVLKRTACTRQYVLRWSDIICYTCEENNREIINLKFRIGKIAESLTIKVIEVEKVIQVFESAGIKNHIS